MKSSNDKPKTDDIVESVLANVASVGIKIGWFTNRPEPGNSERRTRKIGDSGFDLAKIKEWEPGDRVDGIASAKTGWREILATQYEEPRDLSIWVVIDAGATMVFGTQQVSERVLAAQLLGKIFGAAARDDLTGLIVYDEKGVRETLPLRGARRQIVPALYTYLDSEDPSEVEENETRSGLEQALSRIPHSTPSLVWVISPFLELSSAETEALEVTSALHDVLCLAVTDPRERELPDGHGILQMRDLRTGKAISIWLSKRTRAEWTREYDERQSEIRKKLNDAGTSYMEFGTGMDSEMIDQLLVPLLHGIRTQE